MTLPDITGEAETLIRALQGVRHARIDATDDGIESVHVTAYDADAARDMAAHVRSALLAGLAAPVLAGSIHVRVQDDDAADTDTTPRDERPAPRDRIRLIHDANNALARDADLARARTGPVETVDAPAATAHAADGYAAHPDAPVTARPRLVSVDAHRPGDGRLVCRVAIAYRTHVHRAEAVAVDLPGAAAQAAAQATVRALADAGIAGIELSGLREVEIAGRDYVVVALRRTEPYTRTRSGSAPIIGSAERSAAEATVAAAHETE